MSRRYDDPGEVPQDVLVKRLRELSSAVSSRQPGKTIPEEFTMRIPAEVDRDADIVLCEAAIRLEDTTYCDALKQRLIKEALLSIPTNWVDSLLTGDARVIGEAPYSYPDLEKLLLAIRTRMEQRLKEVS